MNAGPAQLLDLRSGEVTILFDTPVMDVAYTQGYLVYVRPDNVMSAVPFDASAGRITGTPVEIANDVSVSTEERSVSKDLKVVDNGDRTLTITVLATGNFTVYGEDGKAIARNPGQTRFQFIVDHAGTPTDPSDDVLLEDLGTIKGSTGRSDDFCTAVVAALT